jgi:hypothetical protein
MNRTASVIAGIYFLITAGIAVRTALDPAPGFGALKHMFTFLATAPVSVPLSMLGHEPDLGSNWVAAGVVLAATAVVYGVVVLVGRLF